MKSVDRRRFLKGAAQVFAAGGASAALRQLTARAGEERPVRASFTLSPVHDEATDLPLLCLPAGWRYRSFGWTGDPLACGCPTPGAHDAMSVIGADADRVTLCRNQELDGDGSPFSDAAPIYDPAGPGGCVSIDFDIERGRPIECRASLTGTVKNCAGGPTPWGSWLSCEETVLGPGDALDGRRLKLQREHGFVFEVPVVGKPTAEPLRAMGRFVHEAVAVDSATGCVYQTEDRTTAGFYRFTPNTPGDLAAGGRLQMLKARGHGDLSRGLTVRDRFDVEWVDIEEPQRAHSRGTNDTLGVYSQGKARGAATFSRLEGCWFSNDRIFIASTDGGDASLGQVFAYDPRNEVIELLFESPAPDVLECPDNLTACPAGGLLLCEDGDRSPQRLQWLDDKGALAPLAANNVVLDGTPHNLRGDFREQEWAGACFSPDGRWLFANIQTPGFTVAIRWGEVERS